METFNTSSRSDKRRIQLLTCRKAVASTYMYPGYSE